MGILSGSDIDRIKEEALDVTAGEILRGIDYRRTAPQRTGVFTEPGEYIPQSELIVVTGIAAGNDGGNGGIGNAQTAGSGGGGGASGEWAKDLLLKVEKGVPVDVIVGAGNVVLTQNGKVLLTLLKGGAPSMRRQMFARVTGGEGSLSTFGSGGSAGGGGSRSLSGGSGVTPFIGVNNGSGGAGGAGSGTASSGTGGGGGGGGGAGLELEIFILIDRLSKEILGVSSSGGSGGVGATGSVVGKPGANATGFGTGGGGASGSGSGYTTPGGNALGGKGAPGVLTIAEYI